MSDEELFYGKALWYAFGYLDNGQGIGPSLKAKLDAFEFASWVKGLRAEFNTNQKIVHFKSVQELWADYMNSKFPQD